MRALITTLLFITASVFLFSCDDGGNDYFFQNPVSGSVITNVKCVNGSVSYIGFVVDNTEKYGARLMKISGCGEKIDKNFKDDADDKTGIYIGGSGAGVDHVIKDGNVILGVISSGQVDYDHYKNDQKKLEPHRGRLVLRTLVDNFKHDKDKDSSVLFDFHPALVKSDGKGFVVYGTYFGKNYLAYVNMDGTKKVVEIDYKIKDIVLSNGKVLIYNGSNQLFSVDSELNLKVVWKGSPGAEIKSSGIAALTKARTALFFNMSIIVFDHNFKIVDHIKMPENYLISSVASAQYTNEFLYRSFPQEKMLEKVVIYEAEESEVNTDSDDFMQDDDTEAPDMDTYLKVFAADDNDSETEDADSDNETGDDDIVAETEVLDAKDGDVVWIATENGTVMAYDLESKSWMVTYYSEAEAEDLSEYSLEMRPYLESSFTSYPEYGDTNLDNAPFIRKISAARGLARSFIYNFTYEGIVEASRSQTGTLSAGMVLTDENADFEKMSYDIDHDRVILLNRKQNSDCIVPLNTNVTMDIESIDSQTEMTVGIEEFSDSVSDCYGDIFSYGIYTEDRYCVTREDVNGKVFSGRAEELSAQNDGDEVSFSDKTIDVSIMRKTDQVKTSKETNFYIKINPGVPFVGINSNDLIVDMEQTVPGKILMFSPLTRRFIEYDFENRTVVEVYK